jgi:conjugative relaxase-like TrwC/TraI family protein
MHGGVKVYRGTPSAARTYLETEHCRVDDYYLREGVGVAEHLTVDRDGHVLERPGLSGDRYEAWVAGLDPDTGEARGRLRGDGHAVRFLEIVVNGPKSWSLAAELHPDIATVYEAAQERAARQILGWLGEHATTRVGPRGQQVAVPVERLEAAVIRHYTSRARDPHRHLHLQVNARVFAAGRWRGLDTVAVRDSIQALNGIGHAAVVCDPGFRAALAAHGYTLSPEGEIAQLAPFVGAFSKRAAQIGRLLDRYEAAWRAEHPNEEPGPGLRRGWDARAWAQDRPDKVVPRNGAELRQRWLSELHQLGYRDPNKPIQLALPLPGAIDRDAAAIEVITRLGTRHSAWNAADVRGEVEQLLARAGVIAEPAVRGELAEDLTARAVELCTPLTTRDSVPDHIRALTCRHVLDVEADLVSRLADRSAGAVAPREAAADAKLDDGQRLAVAALSGDARLVVIEGAAGAGKTTTLAATRDALAQQGRRLVVVTPTRKAAHAASVEIGTQTGSAAWLAWQHGWRWDEHGRWTRQPADPGLDARLGEGDLLLCDEAGMLDQDTARALLTLADEAGARIVLVGDRHQLPAVGRGGVLDVALRWCHPSARIDLDTVHRFVHTIDGQLVPDQEYAALSLQIRTGDDPAAVFDALHTRGQIVIYPSEIDRQDALAAEIATARQAGATPAVMVDTREHADTLNTAIREQLITAGQVDDHTVAVTGAGQRIGAGDAIVTRRNDAHRDIANREAWTVSRVHHDGQLTITAPHRGTRQLPAEYVRAYVELGYASTGYGVQGDTTEQAHLILTDNTTAASAYVAMTRGREANTAHLVATDLADAREQWLTMAGRDRADLGADAAREAAERAAAGYTASTHPSDQPVEVDPERLYAVLRELQQVWSERAKARSRLERLEAKLELATREAAWSEQCQPILLPLREAVQHARATAEQSAHAAATSAAALRTAVEQHLAALRQEWQSRLADADAAARTVAAGTGRLGLHRGRVRDAEKELDRWRDAWAPVLADSGLDPHDLHQQPHAWHADAPRIGAALHEYAQRLARAEHPGHTALEEFAEQTRATAETAEHCYREREYQLRAEFGLPHYRTVTERVPDLTDAVETARQRLDAVEDRMTALVNDPAVNSPEAELLLRKARQYWQHDHTRDNPHLGLADPIAHPFGTPTFTSSRYDHSRGLSR